MRRVLALIFVLAARAHASPAVELHTSCAVALAEHQRTLRAELERSLAGAAPRARYTLDVTLERLAETPARGELEVVAEVRVLVSDGHGAMRWSSKSRAVVRGAPRARARLRRDAVIEATRALAATIRARL
jgi:hypothetical protein